MKLKLKLNSATCRALVGPLTAAALTAMAGATAQAQDRQVSAEPAHRTTYLNGGIGSGEEHHMREEAAGWPLRMTFSESKTNNFVAGVNLRVTGAHGATWLQLSDAGPMTYAKLPPGTYRISASYDGRVETRNVTLGARSGRDVHFHWNGAA